MDINLLKYKEKIRKRANHSIKKRKIKQKNTHKRKHWKFITVRNINSNKCKMVYKTNRHWYIATVQISPFVFESNLNGKQMCGLIPYFIIVAAKHIDIDVDYYYTIYLIFIFFLCTFSLVLLNRNTYYSISFIR